MQVSSSFKKTEDNSINKTEQLRYKNMQNPQLVGERNNKDQGRN
jgi:hypothetical protein